MGFFVRKIEDLEEGGLRDVLEEVKWRGVISSGDWMLVKPDLLPRPRKGVTTNPALIAGVVEVLKERTDDGVVETDSTGGGRS